MFIIIFHVCPPILRALVYILIPDHSIKKAYFTRTLKISSSYPASCDKSSKKAKIIQQSTWQVRKKVTPLHSANARNAIDKKRKSIEIKELKKTKKYFHKYFGL
jgi:hypothetical protein